ncbi:MAG TPA: hypothetical protein V6C89_02420 [Drouetiella sp.]
MFHFKLLELEAELIAKEEAARGVGEMTPECVLLLQLIESEIGVSLAAKVPQNWRGWLTYRRKNDSLIVCRGRAYQTGMFGKCKAGFDAGGGGDVIADYERHFDVAPSQDIDHLLINFGMGEKTRVFIWYGEGIAAYKLIFETSIENFSGSAGSYLDAAHDSRTGSPLGLDAGSSAGPDAGSPLDPDAGSSGPHAEQEVQAAVVEACSWILKRPKHTTLSEYLKQQVHKS